MKIDLKSCLESWWKFHLFGWRYSQEIRQALEKPDTSMEVSRLKMRLDEIKDILSQEQENHKSTKEKLGLMRGFIKNYKPTHHATNGTLQAVQRFIR